MATSFKVLEVLDVNDFDSQHGKMFGFKLACERGDGKRETIEINAKDASAYKAGTAFWAEPKGTEYKGIKKYKKVKPPDDAPQSRGGAPRSDFGHGANLPPAIGVAKAPAMPYADAMALYQKVLHDQQYPELAVPLWAAILEGQVENPAKPKAVVRFYGKDLETAGVLQPAWDEIASLVDRLVRLTDEKHVKALLIATCGVQSRKDLTAMNADLFIEALKLNIANEEAKQPPPADEEEVPF